MSAEEMHTVESGQLTETKSGEKYVPRVPKRARIRCIRKRAPRQARAQRRQYRRLQR